MGIWLALVAQRVPVEGAHDAAGRAHAGDHVDELADRVGSDDAKGVAAGRQRSLGPCVIVAGRRPAVQGLGSSG